MDRILVMKALLAGFLFGVWPLCMNKSGLSGNTSSAVFSFFVLLFVIPFAIRGFGDVVQTNWLITITAGGFAAAGVLCFNGMLAKANPKEVGILVVLMIIMEIVVPAIYQACRNGVYHGNRGQGLFLWRLLQSCLSHEVGTCACRVVLTMRSSLSLQRDGFFIFCFCSIKTLGIL